MHAHTHKSRLVHIIICPCTHTQRNNHTHTHWKYSMKSVLFAWKRLTRPAQLSGCRSAMLYADWAEYSNSQTGGWVELVLLRSM